MDVSVIIPSLNEAAYLPAQLDALTSQRYDGDWEIVIADNGSSDGTRELIDSRRAHFPHLTLLDASDAPGQAHALNCGLRIASGDALLLLDADDVVAPGYLRSMVSALGQHEFVAARLDCETLNAPWLQASRPPSQTHDVGVQLGFLPAAAGCSLGFRRSVYAETGAFDESFGAGNDIEFCWRYQLNGGRIQFVPEAVVRYRYRSDLRAIFRQARGYGASGPRLYQRFRGRGMPRRPPRAALKFWGGPLRRLLHARSRADQASLVFTAGFRVGLLEGCAESKVIFL